MSNEAEQSSSQQRLFSAKPSTKQKALFSAVKKGDFQKVRELTRAGVNVNFACPPQRGYAAMTPLMEACFEGHFEIVRLLLNSGADVSATSEELAGTTPLYYAVVSDKREAIPEIVRELLERGADPNQKIRQRSETLFNVSIRSGAIETVRLLLGRSANVNVPPASFTSPLHQAADVGDAEIAAELVKRGAQVNFQSSDGWTALMQAAKGGHSRVVELLLEHGADPNLQTKEGDTTLTLVADKIASCYDEKQGDQCLAVIKLLVQAGADMNAQAPNGWTVLDLAEHNAMKDHEVYGPRWFGKGAEYLRSVGAKRVIELG